MYCRTCLRDDQFLSVPIAAVSEANQEIISLMLIYCAQLQISSTDCLPQQICIDCLTKLDEWYGFWRQCRQADVALRCKLLETTEAVLEPAPEDDSVDVKDFDLNIAFPVPSETGGISQSYFCCFSRCDQVFPSMEELEDHASQEHWLKRCGYQKKRRPEHRHHCSVCLYGFTHKSAWKFHQLLLLGKRKQGSCCGRCRRVFQSAEELTVHQNGQCNEALDREDSGTTTSQSIWFKKSEEKDKIKAELKAKLETACSDDAQKKEPIIVEISGAELGMLEAKANGLLRQLRQWSINRYSRSIRLVHVCETCDTRVTKASLLAKHQDSGSCHGSFEALELCAAGTGVIQCSNCTYRTATSCNMKRHKKFCTLRQLRKYCCSNCGSNFPKLYNLNRHLVETGCSSERTFKASIKRTFNCEHCSRTCSTISALNRHLQYCSAIVVTNPWHCLQCGEGFHKKHDLTKHQQEVNCVRKSPKSIETKTRATCTFCSKTYTRMDNLYRHQRKGCPVKVKRKLPDAKESIQDDVVLEISTQDAELECKLEPPAAD